MLRRELSGDSVLPTWHLIEGEAGCVYAREHGCSAVIVDALRASATAAMLLEYGAREILVVAEVADALRAREKFWPDALLYGERGGLPPEGFDHGNSPREAHFARDRRVIFTTSNGSARLLQAYDAPSVHFGSTTNAAAVVEALAGLDRDVVLIPAGKIGQPDYDAQEDWVAAAVIAMTADQPIGEGALYFRDTRALIELDGVLNLFEGAPHAGELRRIGLADDIAFCARSNIASAVPTVTGKNDFGLLVGGFQ
jgi:2-phosphosulfolactate phosphatase